MKRTNKFIVLSLILLSTIPALGVNTTKVASKSIFCSILGAAAGFWNGLITSPENWKIYTAVGAALGAVAGGISSYEEQKRSPDEAMSTKEQIAKSAINVLLPSACAGVFPAVILLTKGKNADLRPALNAGFGVFSLGSLWLVLMPSYRWFL